MSQSIFAPKKKKEQVLHLLAMELRKVFQTEHYDFEKLQEIRMRAGSPLLVVYQGDEYLVTESGQFRKDVRKKVLVTAEHIRESLEYISNYSMYAFEEEIRQGYLTVTGGHRVGLAGKVIWERGEVRSIRSISFLNIRLAHEVIGCADTALSFLYKKGELCNTLIISPPGCGKTTLLRDIVRQVSDGNRMHAGMTVGVVDERSEIGACYKGEPQNNLGCRTDVLDGCPKSEGMIMLVRSMAPGAIAVDEIGTTADIKAMKYIMNSGVRLLATVHGASIEEIRKKPVLGELIKDEAFERYILLEAGKTGKISGFFDKHGREICL